MKKYELVKTDRPDGLFQIKALKDGPWGPAGTFGGFVESADNLSQEDECWVYGDARVSENACVSENARVFGNAEVFGDAEVFGNARVFGKAQVYGNARVFGDAEVFGNARVFGNAQVYEDARVFGDALVFGNAQVFGKARVYGNASVSSGDHTKTPLFIQGTEHGITVCSADVINVGCESHPIDFWLKNANEIGKAHNYTKEQIDEYLNHFRYIKSLF